MWEECRSRLLEMIILPGGGGGEIIGATWKIGRKLEESEERRAQTDHQQRPERVRDREETERETEKRQRLVRKITF